MGDPSGVGPEVICKALAALPAERRGECMVIGDPAFLARANQVTGAGVAFGDHPGAVPVVAVDTPEKDTIRDGEIGAGGGHAAYGYVVKAVGLALAGEVSVIVTAPLNKAALNLAGHEYDGHTGLLQHLTRAPASFMLLASDKLSAIHVSTHVSLAEAVRRTRRERVLETIRAGHTHFRRLGMARPRIACAGLNPHCGEGGIFGREDIDEIAPAVEAARAQGIEASGPYPADTVFYRAVRGEFDLVVANYHDQGHIPTKLIAFDSTVNVSLGLPIQRTSVDHGTAFDIAWTGKADHTNMLAALAYARRMASAAPLAA
jgi:4-hydroxythreonine-4-phosphate dehydrogenase